MDERALIDLRGIVIAAAWGPDGEVSAVDIAGYDEKRYRIANDPVGCQLLRFVKKAVVISGKLGTDNQQDVVYVDDFRYDTDTAVPDPDP